MTDLIRPSLGDLASLGALYDATRDTFLPESLLSRGQPLPREAVSLVYQQNTSVDFFLDHTYDSKFKMMKISHDLGASFLAGLLEVRGSAAYLEDTGPPNDNILQATVLHRLSFAIERLNVFRPELFANVDPASLQSEATHIITGVECGIQSLVNVSLDVSCKDSERNSLEQHFLSAMDDFKKFVGRIPLEPATSRELLDGFGQVGGMALEITTYSDVFTDEGVVMHDLHEAYNHIALMPIHVQHEYGGRGRPLFYKLLPIGIVRDLAGFDSPFIGASLFVAHEHNKAFIDLIDRFTSEYERISCYKDLCLRNSQFSRVKLGQELSEALHSLGCTITQLKQQYKQALLQVRWRRASPETLSKPLCTYAKYQGLPSTLAAQAEQETRKINFIQSVVAKGATYVGYNEGMSLLSGKTAYALLLDDDGMRDDTWEENSGLFLALLDQPEKDILYAVVDCDAIGLHTTTPCVNLYENEHAAAENILEHRKFMASHCFASYDEASLETKDVKPPVKRRPLRMPCPSKTCDGNQSCDWFCPACRAPLEFGFTDDFIYCECGRALWKDYSFRCNNVTHGSQFEACPSPDRVLATLKGLGQADNINILVLGETGVGKSTFINAFVNYLTFETLQDAMATDRLNYVIPSSFSTQIMDRSRPDGLIQQIDIKIGESRTDEADGSKGASATQQTTVYPVTIGNRTIRLIDTPGIGDTRGLQYDKKNMADLLATLSSYDDLHGILILLKSNNARLTVTFNFCMKELLTHLHRSAARNIAFGFTNTRISNYTPGDTFGSVTTLLRDHADVGLSLTLDTTYCFDSEAFRYLAAFKSGHTLPNEEDFRRSWEHSRQEALRLIGYFEGRTPHKVHSTISLNGTRNVITELTKPMAEISSLIKRNISLLEDEMDELKNTKLTGEDLSKRLRIAKMQLRVRPLDKPRTVCKDSSCIELKSDGTDEDKVVTVYKAHCHPVCYLTDVKAGQVAHPELIHCWAFSGQTHCRQCGHHWQSHLHVLYELEEYMATVTDREVERQLKRHADDVTLKQTAIKKREDIVAEYRVEHETLQEAAARFCVFLKKHSITPYNDATLAYLDMLISDEEAKVQLGGSDKKIKLLKEDRCRHEELVDLLTRNMNNQDDSRYQVLDETGVGRLVHELFNLKHFGQNLKTLKTAIVVAHESTYRERPYRVQSLGPAWSGNRNRPASNGNGKSVSQPRHTRMRESGWFNIRLPSWFHV